MFCWQITKYDPKNRDENRVYLKDDWTEYGDIGQTFDGKKLTFAEYLEVEAKYIQAVLLFMECLGIDTLKVTDLIYRARLRKKALIDGKMIIEGTHYNYEMIAFLIQSMLRDKFDCMLEAENMRVRFCYDYYMVLACSMPCPSTIKQIENMGLFVEKTGREFLFEEEDDE